MNGDTYIGWAFLTGILIFIGVWIYALFAWGLLFGLLFGWLPALIAGCIGGLLWPLVVLAIIGLVILLRQ